ncbi:LytR/AlgR family response regulator transcription factor [Taibaiella chishuiensis]|uniref:LytTR family two component transcriptional regulator n=1 Tax=Taibaiella chishuiensis TaxID=1434707 RepID=A0A2P8CZJ3_9BACT|nr:response regulator transcription factor [Taibaiella chishuiensis]PSK90385.1 LytTR family two component transcriptional regulator [Taibaiella chishuiensis]
MNNTNSSAVIIDDESDSRNMIAFLLQRFFPGITLLGQAENITEGIDLVHRQAPEIVFLDVEMPDGTAFDLLASLTKWSGQVILITAHEHYAIKAIKNEVLDYILKPVDESEFITAVNHALKKKEQPEVPAINLLQDIQKSLYNRKVRVPSANGFLLIEADELIRCEAAGNYTRLYFANSKSTLSTRKLGDYEADLKNRGFLRVHNKHLINSRYVVAFTKGKISGGYLTLSNNEMIEVSSRRKGDIMDWFG